MLGALALANMFALSGCVSEQEPVGDDELGSASSSADSTTDSTTESTSESSESELTDSDDSVDSIDEGAFSFYAGPSPDGWGAAVCDPFVQDCPDGEKCVPYARTGSNWDSNKCVPITGIGHAGDPCTSTGPVEATDDCDGSSVCWDVMDVEGESVGVCTAFCTGSPDAPGCEPGTTCLITNEGSVTLCVDQCDPLSQDCAVGLGCFWTSVDFACTVTTQDIPTGEPCGFLNDCALGNYCADAASFPACEGMSCCASFCDLADPICSLAGTECVAFFEVGMAPLGYEDIGVCVVAG